MSEEEKESIKELKEEINKPVELPEDKFDTFILFNIQSAKTVLNYIDKLQKENKELKEDISNMYDEKVVRDILEDECGLSKFEIDEILN